jgi:hypothetical protein
LAPQKPQSIASNNGAGLPLPGRIALPNVSLSRLSNEQQTKAFFGSNDTNIAHSSPQNSHKQIKN